MVLVNLVATVAAAACPIALSMVLVNMTATAAAAATACPIALSIVLVNLAGTTAFVKYDVELTLVFGGDRLEKQFPHVEEGLGLGLPTMK